MVFVTTRSIGKLVGGGINISSVAIEPNTKLTIRAIILIVVEVSVPPIVISIVEVSGEDKLLNGMNILMV